MNAVHTFPPYFSKIHSNIILPSTSTSSEWSSNIHHIEECLKQNLQILNKSKFKLFINFLYGECFKNLTFQFGLYNLQVKYVQ
jgi:hypothetical protein